MTNPRFQRLAGLGAYGICFAVLLLYALVAFISTPQHTGGIDRTHATIVYIGLGMVTLGLIAVHVVLGRQLLTAARNGELALAAAAAEAGVQHDEHAHGAHGHHPTAMTYVIIGVILTVITAVEVAAYYIPAWGNSAIYVPSMLFLSAVKFTTVVLFYMHLKYDHRLFRALFSGPFVVAFVTVFGLLFLFGKLAVRLGVLT